MSIALPLLGERVQLRRLAETDLADFQAYRRDVEVARYQGWEPRSDDWALAFLREMAAAPLLEAGQWCQLGIAERQSNRLIGDIGLCRHAEAVEIGFSLARPSQGLGLAFEAMQLLIDEALAPHPVIAITDARNVACLRLLGRLGLQQVATERAMFRGQPCLEHKYRLERATLRL
ncbi:GNAT family N-acetyltransferase [Pelomonas sp. V22]|uniref:GNAT family N-acetyltransferase n=1 Tax=Pelomonas sp. V22 TaxID=2822139 RepID=UPI0024A8D4ED|nr:GNAT family N-acetyltransferase [Pelomonas sp. V22]MDI4634460.1 GNAT family N-acetyltransferase [Pelomonas sp. V22]